MSKTTSWYADRYVTHYGFKLVPLKPNGKLPIRDDWGNKLLNDDASDYYTTNPTHNMGVELGSSGICSLDIDCADSWALILEEYGIPADSLDSYPTIQGKGKRVMFRVPADAVIKYAKLNWPRKEDPTKQYTVIELRTSDSTKQRQDVLPPSIHPDTGEPYRWIVQPPKSIDEWPEPPDWLLAIWEAWDSFKPQFKDVCPWAVKRELPAPTPRASEYADTSDDESPISVYLAHNTLHEKLNDYGYKRVGKRYLSPHSGTGLPGVIVFSGDQSCWIHHASDPLCSEESGKPVNAFDLYCYYEHNNDASAACKHIVELYDIKRKRQPAPEVPSISDDMPPEMPMDDYVDYAGPVGGPSAPASEPTSSSAPFKALGYNGTHYYYLPRGTEQVVELKRGAHTSPAELISLASLEWWEAHYPKQGKNVSGVEWQAAANSMMRACERAGIYGPEKERGRGAWHDAGRAVLHMGDHLLVDGVRTSISDHASRYIYVKGSPVASGLTGEPLTASESSKVLEVIRSLAWTKPIHADLMAGWCALAPVCGALSWRPHVWLTAQRGAGKSWVQDRIVKPLIGPMAMMVQGSTTEAGIRQRVQNDARCIVFDEAEAENQQGQKRIQTILELARQSSSDTSAEIIKGTVSGAAMSFRMRSMFFLGSINVAIRQAADESRFSVLQLARPQMSTAQFSEFEARVDGLLSDSFCGGLRARLYRRIPEIRKSAKTLSTVVTDLLGSQRMGDQIGTLLAGCWVLRSDDPIDLDTAQSWVGSLDFSDAEEAEQVSDEMMCLQSILEGQIRFDGPSSILQRSIGELVEIVIENDVMGGAQYAAEALARHGIKIDDGYILISNTHTQIKKILSETAWATGWRRILVRLPGAYATQKAIRFAGSISKSVAIPYAITRNM